MKFATKTKGIGGKIKQRISDFKVTEIPPKKRKLHEEVEQRTQKENHLVFWMEKFNWDTSGALLMISNKANIPVDRFYFAGTKDKRAITKQRVSVLYSEEMEQSLKHLNICDIKLNNFSRGKKLNLGESEGNEFEIIIRNITLDKDEIEKRIKSVFTELEKGIPNIFGPQRFGETRPVTYPVGKQLVLGNPEEAAKIYLTQIFPKESKDAKKAREFLAKHWNRKGFLKALEIFPDRLRYERMIINQLTYRPTDFAGAFSILPKKLLKLFPNAVQSWIFNRAIKKIDTTRVKQESEIPMVGFDTIFGNNDLSGLIKKIMRDEGIKKSDFNLKIFSHIRCSGGFRRILLRLENPEILEISEDKFNKGKIQET